MTKTKTRVAISLAALALTAATAAAPAGAMTPLAGTATKATGGAPQAVSRSVTTRPTLGGQLALPTKGSSVAEVSAGSTGDGPADDDECDQWASDINDEMAGLREDAATGSGDVREDINNINILTDVAQDRGCFIVYD